MSGPGEDRRTLLDVFGLTRRSWDRSRTHASVLSLPYGKLLHAQGWGGSGGTANFRVELSRDQLLVVFREGWAGEKPALQIPPHLLWLQVGTANVQSGGGFFGGGFGLEGAATGMLEASLLNALTARNREYTLLTVGADEPNGTRRVLIFGYRNIDESTLRDQLARAIPEWTEPFVTKLLGDLQAASLSGPELAATRQQITQMAQRGILTPRQIARLEAALPPPPPDDFQEDGSPVVATTATELERLASLHRSGALTDDEFRAAKAKLLG